MAKLKNAAIAEGVVSLVSGIESKTPEFEDAMQRVEFRFYGPAIVNTSKSDFYLNVALNVLVHSVMEEKRNRYHHDVLLGYFADILLSPIKVLRLGPDPLVDTKESIGCLFVTEGKNAGVRVHHFDSPDTNDPVRNGMVTAEFSMCLYIQN